MNTWKSGPHGKDEWNRAEVEGGGRVEVGGGSGGGGVGGAAAAEGGGGAIPGQCQCATTARQRRRARLPLLREGVYSDMLTR